MNQEQKQLKLGRIDESWPLLIQARAHEVLVLRSQLTEAVRAASDVDMLDERKPPLLMRVSETQLALGRAYANLAKELVFLIAQRKSNAKKDYQEIRAARAAFDAASKPAAPEEPGRDGQGTAR